MKRPLVSLVAAPLLGVALLGAAGCDDPRPESPRAVLEALREALREHDGRRILDLQDAESRGGYRDRVRQLKASVARGDDVDGLLAGLELTADGVRAASEDELAGHFMVTRSFMAKGGEFLRTAEIEDEASEGPDVARIDLIGKDDEEMRLWFLREPGRGWVLDTYRTTRGR